MPKAPEMTQVSRRALLTGLAAATALGPSGLGARAATVAARGRPPCGLGLGAGGFRSSRDWDAVFTARWGALGPQSRRQIETMIHAKNGRYDDSDGVFAWIVHYWIRAWVAMARLTGERKYLQACVSLIDYMLDHTDERRVTRGEITENYVRDPLYLKGTGRGGPFWKRGRDAIVLNTGQVANGILRVVDAVYSDRGRFAEFLPAADRAFAQCRIAVDAFDNDWQVVGNKGSYHYRDSAGSGDLGVTRAAFNQSATMVGAHLMIHKWRPDPARADKVRRLTQYWLEDFAIPRADGSYIWPYMIHPELGVMEDAGHASIDVDFLVMAYESGLTDLTEAHMAGLSKTYLLSLVNGHGGLNQFVDGTTRRGFDEHWNAAIGWFGLARYEPHVALAALNIYATQYPFDAPDGRLWARPMLGWANLLTAARSC